ncbi:hypothetical protein NP493_2g05001 [Ridgeia piscesae]|uniref:Cytochrome b-c1 complex subunit 6 n=1 Tax=Ridgeia piscesae TaxID=27915 RepID=A0AAD9PGF8_RIDPI|nr:hypothetical protein NP493_2g05001 [Ridgeia piscesae]
MGLKDAVVVATDPQEEEEEVVDPQEELRAKCGDSGHCEKYKAELDACTERVSSRQNTAETCTQELFDFMHCVDHCASKSLFSRLK